MQCELTVACYIISPFLFTPDSFDKLHLKLQRKQRVLHTEDSNIIVAFLAFMLLCEICKFQLLKEYSAAIFRVTECGSGRC